MGVGHSTIFTAPVWNDSFAIDSNQQVCTSSWGVASSFSTKLGVQYEPLTYWINTPGEIHLLAIGSSVWVWDWFNSHWSYTGDATYPERKQAADFAVAQLNKPYNWLFANKWNTDAYYCSSLVWRAWFNVNSKYDLSPASPICAPMDIYNSLNKRFVYQE